MGKNRDNEKKGLFIHGSPLLTEEEVEKIAKRQARKIGFKGKNLVVRHIQYVANLEGWMVVIQKGWNAKKPMERQLWSPYC